MSKFWTTRRIRDICTRNNQKAKQHTTHKYNRVSGTHSLTHTAKKKGEKTSVQCSMPNQKYKNKNKASNKKILSEKTSKMIQVISSIFCFLISFKLNKDLQRALAILNNKSEGFTTYKAPCAKDCRAPGLEFGAQPCVNQLLSCSLKKWENNI